MEIPDAFWFVASPVVVLAVIVLLANWRNVHANLDMIIAGLIEATTSRGVVRTRQLVVHYKYEVAANSYPYIVNFQLDSHSPVVQLVREYPERDLWVIGSTVRVFGPIYLRYFGVAVDHDLYMSVAPGDMIDNPHYGEINPEAWVDPSLSYIHACPQ